MQSTRIFFTTQAIVNSLKAFLIRVITLKKNNKDEEIVRKSIFFDKKYYRTATKISIFENAASHFCRIGWRLGVDPSPFFDVQYYLTNNVDVDKTSLNPLIHFIQNGAREQRRPSPYFDANRFLERHPECLENAAEFCLNTYGQYVEIQGEWPLPKQNRISIWIGTSRKARKHFDSGFYIGTYPDIIIKKAYNHYYQHGYLENRDPHPLFDTFYYKFFNRHKMLHPNPFVYYNYAGKYFKHQTSSSTSLLLQPIDKLHVNMSSILFHIFLPRIEILCLLMPYVANFLSDSVILISVTTEADKLYVTRIFGSQDKVRPIIQVIAKLGSPVDILLEGLTEPNYDRNKVRFVCHFHGDLDFECRWMIDNFHYTLHNLIGSSGIIKSIVQLMESDRQIGGAFPRPYFRMKGHLFTESVIGNLNSAKSQHESDHDSPNKSFYPGNTFGWFRMDALESAMETYRKASENLLTNLDSFRGSFYIQDLLLFAAITKEHYKILDVITTEIPSVQRIDYVKKRSFSPSSCVWLRERIPNFAIELRKLEFRDTFVNKLSLNIHWIVPHFGAPGAGGHMTIFRVVRNLQAYGHRNYIWIHGDEKSTCPDKIKRQIQMWYQPIPNSVVVQHLPDDLRSISGDVIIATDFWTAIPTASVTNFKDRFYFVQDLETLFNPAGSRQLVAEMTYKLDIAYLCAGSWLKRFFESKGHWTRSWELAVDRDVYFSDSSCCVMTVDKHVAFYARVSTPRRAVEIGVAALNLLSKSEPHLVVHMFGQDSLVNLDIQFNYVNHGIKPPVYLAKLYRNCHVGLVLSATNYSLVPLEMMMCDLPVVELDVDSTRTIYPSHEVYLAGPNPRSIAKAIENLLKNDDVKEKQKKSARAFVEKLSWEKTAKDIETFIQEKLLHSGFLPINPVEVCEKNASRVYTARERRACVVIESSADLSEFGMTVEAVSGQDRQIDFEIVALNNGTNDELIKQICYSFDLTIQVVSVAGEQMFGDRMNAVMHRTDADFVIYVDQFSRPRHRDWFDKMISGFSEGDRVAGVIGRQESLHSADLYHQMDLNIRFNELDNIFPVLDSSVGLPSFMDVMSFEWKEMYSYFPNTNVAISRDVWKKKKFRAGEWGAEKLWIYDLMQLGFQRVYSAAAIADVRENPKSDISLYEQSFNKGVFFSRYFGQDASIYEDVLKDEYMSRDKSYANQNGISDVRLVERMHKNKIVMAGLVAGANHEKQVLI
ncbi:glycosyltransferase [Methylobacterium sp. C25]|uniref:glycosyltransferase family 4 protein n=1 Tax=Methylobacterium sp. C25 TaxID=2721622 RepID=UPI001F2F93F3|nr:glycosyltransferase family 4 protein [Methylobacterium sp. C25]MCE4226375.1 glycosyltransferase [Methylobacterium sp. C25]